METFTLIIEAEDVPEVGVRWTAVCSELGLFIEEATEAEARQTAIDLAPEMYAHYLEHRAERGKLEDFRLRFETGVRLHPVLAEA